MLDDIDQLLQQNRLMHDFVGRHLPFSLADEPTFEPVRYHLGDDDWLELMILYYPEWGWEVHVLERSSDEFDLTDVYLDMLRHVGTTFGIHAHPSQESAQPTILKDILSRLERLERVARQPEAVHSIPSPYLNAEEAADYLRLTVNALYGLVERRKVKPLPGHRKYRFTQDILDAYLMGK
jgi:hypothetical protein